MAFPHEWWQDEVDQPRLTKDEALAAYGDLAAEHQLAVEQMTPREQAEAAWTPTSKRTVDELEALIREQRGYPPLERGGAPEVRPLDGN